MSAWNKDLSAYIGPWLEPLLGVFLVVGGVRVIIAHEYRYRGWVYHGALAELAGALMLLGAFLLFRGRIWRNRDWEKWTVLDKVVGTMVAVGILCFLVQRWISIL